MMGLTAAHREIMTKLQNETQENECDACIMGGANGRKAMLKARVLPLIASLMVLALMYSEPSLAAKKKNVQSDRYVIYIIYERIGER